MLETNKDLLQQMKKALFRMKHNNLHNTNAYKRLLEKYEEISNETDYKIVDSITVTHNGKTIEFKNVVIKK